LLVVTYDEHGGTYDHVAPPHNAKQPKDCLDNDGFDFQRFGVRVPTVLVSPLIEEGTVYRTSASRSATSLDHTSILATPEKRFGLPNLTARDAAAPDFAGVLTLQTPHKDDPLESITLPKSEALPKLESNGCLGKPDHLQLTEASLAAQLPMNEQYHSRYFDHGDFKTEHEVKKYTSERYNRCHAQVGSSS
jgi:phospholipase C